MKIRWLWLVQLLEEVFKLKKISFERKWIHCPYCGAKHSIYEDNAECKGVFLKCTRGCKNEFELVIKNGEQICTKI